MTFGCTINLAALLLMLLRGNWTSPFRSSSRKGRAGGQPKAPSPPNRHESRNHIYCSECLNEGRLTRRDYIPSLFDARDGFRCPRGHGLLRRDELTKTKETC